MKRFHYSLDSVLAYKNQILDNLKEEHAVMLHDVNAKKEEIAKMRSELNEFQNDFDSAKQSGATIQDFQLYDMCIGQMVKQIDAQKEVLTGLQKKEEKKKTEVINAKVDTSRFEKLKSRRFREYQKLCQKEEEAFIEEFVVRGLTTSGRQSHPRG